MLSQERETPPRESRSKESIGKKNSPTPPKTNYRGITLKEYFRLCDKPSFQDPIREMAEESKGSSIGSPAEPIETPSFPTKKYRRMQRGKTKTEINEEEIENLCKNNQIRNVHVHEAAYFEHHDEILNRGKANSIMERGGLNMMINRENPFRRKEERKKAGKLHSNATKHNIEAHNRSTLSSFYQCEENKKKMLKKLRVDKDKINELRLSEAFFITKYGSKFQIDAKQLIK